MNHVSRIVVTQEALSQALGLPEGCRVTDARRQFGGLAIELAVEGNGCRTVPEGGEPYCESIDDIVARAQGRELVRDVTGRVAGYIDRTKV